MESQNDDVIANLVKKLNSSIDLNGEQLNPSDLSTVGYIMIKSKHPIKSLNLYECLCGADGIKALFHQIQQSSVEHTSLSLEKLNLSFTAIGADAAKCLADGLQHCPNLQTLDLSENFIGDDGAKCLADGLQHCPNLQILDLSDNYIVDEGARYISEGLKHCPRLQTLNVSGNKITREGKATLVKMKKEMNSKRQPHEEKSKIGNLWIFLRVITQSESDTSDISFSFDDESDDEY